MDNSELGIEVCASCGGSNINNNHKKNMIKSLPADWCFDCLHNEGTSICMPDDKLFYNQAKETLSNINK